MKGEHMKCGKYYNVPPYNIFPLELEISFLIFFNEDNIEHLEPIPTIFFL